ncbi:alpha/beta-Hydrolases superfamily protein [Actinidia rufa]|uniref:Alpha/beta-Hydrolases superfamily protein n=1 Tax=Actinidia rufa TaxID=165716 RepID=A0A7J0D924_9ERIC|nr:alpha/beta-Hydrolases superfamily protein [Actinidia rufa]
MSEVTGSKSWRREEFMSLVEDTGIRYTGDAIGISTPAFEAKRSELVFEESVDSESLKDQVKGFVKAWREMVVELGKGCKDIVQQNFLTEDSYVVQKLRGPVKKVSGRLSFLNGYLLEDRDPFHAWSVVVLVFLFAFAANEAFDIVQYCFWFTWDNAVES